MDTTWHGEYRLPIDSTSFWRAGPFHLWVKRSAHEWKVAVAQGADALDRTLLVEAPSDRLEPPTGSTIQRFGYQQTPENITLTPVLADRPVVVSPEEPLYVPPQEEIIVFISTPVWIELKLGDSVLALLDEPTFRPTDTWFGPSPMKGELCYATRTAARMKLDSLPSRPHRVISAVEIRNRAKTILAVENLKIPVMHQSVYATKAGNLWTETVILDHHEEGALANVRLGKSPPKEAGDTTLVRGPRTPMDGGILTRAFGGLVP